MVSHTHTSAPIFSWTAYQNCVNCNQIVPDMILGKLNYFSIELNGKHTDKGTVVWVLGQTYLVVPAYYLVISSLDTDVTRCIRRNE